MENLHWKKLVRNILSEFKLSNNELAIKVGVTPSTIGNILNGVVITPRKSLIRKLESGLDIKITGDTFEKISVGKQEEISVGKQLEILMPVILEYNLGVLNIQYVQTNAAREEPIPYYKATNVFLVEVQTDSMSPKIVPGDRLLVDLDEKPKNQSLVIILLKDGEKHIGEYNEKYDSVVINFEKSLKSPAILSKEEIKQTACIRKLIRDV